MTSTLQPGRFNGANLSTDRGELHLRVSDGGNWQLRVRGESEAEWRLLCSGNFEGGVNAAPPEEARGPIAIGPLPPPDLFA